MASALPVPGTANAEGTFLGSGDPLIVIPPEWADKLSKDGISPQKACALLHEWSAIPLDRLSPSIAASLDDTVRVTGRVYVARSPESIVLIIAGAYRGVIEHFPFGGGGYVVASTPLVYRAIRAHNPTHARQVMEQHLNQASMAQVIEDEGSEAADKRPLISTRAQRL